MTGKVFVDSNILVYAHDADAGPKQKIAAAHKALWEDQSGRISTQVLQEILCHRHAEARETVSQEQSPRNYSRLCAMGGHSNNTPDGYSRLRDQRRVETVVLGQPDTRGGRAAGLLHCAHRRLECRSNRGWNPSHQSVLAESGHVCPIAK
jgi:hypothetical protein